MSCCCCCCPPAITALLYLWVRSGFSKGSVAGVLTFFPPDPPLYKFQRVSADGEVLPEEECEDGVGDSDGGEGDVAKAENCEDVDCFDDGDDDDSDLGTFEVLDAAPSRDTGQAQKVKNKDGDPEAPSRDKGQAQKVKNKDGDREKEEERLERLRRKQQQQREDSERRQREAASQDPIVAMTERSAKLRQQAKRRARQDRSDAENGVTYNFLPDLAALGGSLPSFNGTVHPMKIGPQKRTGTYVAALLYKLPPSECFSNTKTILYSHGNATDVGAMSGLQCLISKNVKCHVLVYDYSGYGESGGIPLEKNTYRDVKMVYEWVVSNVAEGKEGNIVLYGQSVGSGPSCYLASRRKDVGGLVLHSPFTSGMRVLTPSRALACLDIFPNIDRIKKVKCPVFIIHGKKDAEVVWEHGMALQAAVPDDCRRDPWWVPDKGHNDIVDGPSIVEYIQKLNRFIRSLNDD